MFGFWAGEANGGLTLGAYVVVTRNGMAGFDRKTLRKIGYKPHPIRVSARTGQGSYSKFYWTLDDAIEMPSKVGAQRREKTADWVAKTEFHAKRCHEIDPDKELLNGGIKFK